MKSVLLMQWFDYVHNAYTAEQIKGMMSRCGVNVTHSGAMVCNENSEELIGMTHALSDVVGRSAHSILAEFQADIEARMRDAFHDYYVLLEESAPKRRNRSAGYKHRVNPDIPGDDETGLKSPSPNRGRAKYFDTDFQRRAGVSEDTPVAETGMGGESGIAERADIIVSELINDLGFRPWLDQYVEALRKKRGELELLYENRNWKRIEHEVIHLTNTAVSYGYPSLSGLAYAMKTVIEEKGADAELTARYDRLIKCIDQIIAGYPFNVNAEYRHWLKNQSER